MVMKPLDHTAPPCTGNLPLTFETLGIGNPELPEQAALHRLRQVADSGGPWLDTAHSDGQA
jgi:hypothetical protein